MTQSEIVWTIVIYFSFSLYPVDEFYLTHYAIISGGILQRSQETWQCCRIVSCVSKQGPPLYTFQANVMKAICPPPHSLKKKAPGTDPHVLTSNELSFLWKMAALCCNASTVIAGQTRQRWHSESFMQTYTVTTLPHDSFFFLGEADEMLTC